MNTLALYGIVCSQISPVFPRMAFVVLESYTEFHPVFSCCSSYFPPICDSSSVFLIFYVPDSFEKYRSIILQHVFPFRFVWYLLLIKLRLCIFDKNITEVIDCQCYIEELCDVNKTYYCWF